VGILLASGQVPSYLIWFEGKYGDLLSVNIWGTLLCFAGFFLPLFLRKKQEPGLINITNEPAAIVQP
ncbi:MAG TPA: hypothetical protein VEY32_04410, partial [Flavisolibacter sp.]|nr:hypothetical protein [Flavisolibacter sp.]